MEKKIALEEHFMHPDFVDYWSNTAINISPELFGKVRNKLEDFGERRLNEMDSIGVKSLYYLLLALEFKLSISQIRPLRRQNS